MVMLRHFQLVVGAINMSKIPGSTLVKTRLTINRCLFKIT